MKNEEERGKEGSLKKLKHRKLKKEEEEEEEKAGDPRVTRSGALNPPLRTCHVAIMHLAPPLCIKYGEKPQETRLSKKPFTSL